MSEPEIILDEIRGLGHVNRGNMALALSRGFAFCRETFGGQDEEACRRGVSRALKEVGRIDRGPDRRATSIAPAATIRGRALTGAELGRLKQAIGPKQLGIFHECALKCPAGTEKLIVRKPDLRPHPRNRERARDMGICVCRLGIKFRKKFVEPKFDVKEENRTPFGRNRNPVHLRRRREFAPVVTARDIEKLR